MVLGNTRNSCSVLFPCQELISTANPRLCSTAITCFALFHYVFEFGLHLPSASLQRNNSDWTPCFGAFLGLCSRRHWSVATFYSPSNLSWDLPSAMMNAPIDEITVVLAFKKMCCVQQRQCDCFMSRNLRGLRYSAGTTAFYENIQFWKH